jgi:hypothetical protein
VHERFAAYIGCIIMYDDQRAAGSAEGVEQAPVIIRLN